MHAHLFSVHQHMHSWATGHHSDRREPAFAYAHAGVTAARRAVGAGRRGAGGGRAAVRIQGAFVGWWMDWRGCRGWGWRGQGM
jgi:hypothetical protein